MVSFSPLEMSQLLRRMFICHVILVAWGQSIKGYSHIPGHRISAASVPVKVRRISVACVLLRGRGISVAFVLVRQL